MSRSLFSGILFVLIAHATAFGQPTSDWWYPYGSPEATRNNPAPTDSQQASDLKIKWRTSALKNSPVTLVGGIRSTDSSRQVVGMEERSSKVVILTSTGKVDHVFSVDPFLNNIDGVTFRLTGLFNTEAPSVRPLGNPNAIGIGISRRLGNEVAAFGLILNNAGAQIHQLLHVLDEVDRVRGSSGSDNDSVGIFPIAIYSPPGSGQRVALAIASQDAWTRSTPTDTPVSGLLHYNPGVSEKTFPTTTTGFARLAGRTYERPPSLFFDDVRRLTYAGVSTRSFGPFDYSFDAHAATPIRTFARLGNFVTSLIEPQKLTAVHVDTTTGRGLLFGMYYAPTDVSETIHQEPYPARAAAETLEPGQSTENPRIRFQWFNANYAAALPLVGSAETFRESPTGQPNNWRSVLTADVDGSLPTFPQGLPQRANNPGQELLAESFPDDRQSGRSWLYLFRYNNGAPITPEGSTSARPFYYFTRQLIDGRIAAAGDLVDDPFERQEIVIVNGNTLSIAQLKPYNDPAYTHAPTNRAVFAELYSQTLDDSIVSVAIADLEDDGENDIVVSTLKSTYAIGLPKQAFEIAEEGPTEFCEGEEIALAWQRLIGGGEQGLEVVLLHDGGVAGSLQQSFGTESLVVSPDALGLEPGVYHVVVRDREFGYLADTGREFSIIEREMSLVSSPADGETVALGTTIAGEIATRCIDDPRLEVSLDGAAWEEIPGAVTSTGAGTFDFSTVASCSGAVLCGADSVQQVFYRVVPQGEPDEASASFSVNVALPRARLIVDSGLARLRTIVWDERDFSCDRVSISVSDDAGESWISLGEFATADESARDLLFPPNIAGNVILCVRCAGEDDPGCIAGVARLTLSPFDPTNYVAPNPFDPTAPEVAGQGAAIVYSLSERGLVTITIYDAARSVVRRVIEEEQQDEGTYRAYWDGTNESGRTVANGPYICVIASSSGEQTILPIAVVIR